MSRAIETSGWVVLLLLAAGCGSSGGLTEVTGTVRFQGRPLPSGSVTFVGADGARSHSAINETGEYRVQGVARGKARISVVSEPRVPAGLMKPGPGGPAAPARVEKPIAIPKHFNKAESSGLSVEIDSRKQQHDIDLEP
jgi:hypothetical protein